MKGHIRLLPGTVVLNQDTSLPMSGAVIERPDNESPADGFVWVHWVDGTIALEDPSDLVLTAQLTFDIQ